MPSRWTWPIAMLFLAIPMQGGSLESSPPIASYAFGLTLNTGLNNELFTLFLLKEFEGKVIERAPMTRQQFILQAQGAVPSKANPEAINFFRKYKVNACLHPEDVDGSRFLLDCEVFDHLWKLRFWEYPYLLSEGQHPGKGWSEDRNAPSPRQLMLLADYGMLHVSDMVSDTDVFRLLRDVSDSSWVDNYRKGY